MRDRNMVTLTIPATGRYLSRWPAALALIAMLMSLLPGCALVTIDGASGPQRLINLGPLSLQADQPNRAIISTVRGVGVTAYDGTLNIGYTHQETVHVLEPTHCNLILILKSAEQAEQIKQALGDALGEICSNQ